MASAASPASSALSSPALLAALSRLSARASAKAAGTLLPAEAAAPLLTREEALSLAALPVSERLGAVELGGLTCSLFAGRPFRCGIINAKSGRCPENCAFCAQSKHYATAAPVYGLADEKKLEAAAKRLAEAGASRFGVVASGRGPNNKEIAALAEAAPRVAEASGIALCASLGLLTRERAEALRAAGFTSYHHNLETSRRFFPKICTTHPYELDVETVRTAKAAGFRVCSGGLFGLGEDWTDRIDLALELSALEVDSIPVNFLIPIAGTPLEARPFLEPLDALLIVALVRLLNPTKDVIICGGREKILGRWRDWCWAAGANAVMTGDYLTQKGSAMAEDQTAAEALGLEAAEERSR